MEPIRERLYFRAAGKEMQSADRLCSSSQATLMMAGVIILRFCSVLKEVQRTVFFSHPDRLCSSNVNITDVFQALHARQTTLCSVKSQQVSGHRESMLGGIAG